MVISTSALSAMRLLTVLAPRPFRDLPPVEQSGCDFCIQRPNDLVVFENTTVHRNRVIAKLFPGPNGPSRGDALGVTGRNRSLLQDLGEELSHFFRRGCGLWECYLGPCRPFFVVEWQCFVLLHVSQRSAAGSASVLKQRRGKDWYVLRLSIDKRGG